MGLGMPGLHIMVDIDQMDCTWHNAIVDVAVLNISCRWEICRHG